AEDGIRDYKVTGVQTCALPIYTSRTITESSRSDRLCSAPTLRTRTARSKRSSRGRTRWSGRSGHGTGERSIKRRNSRAARGDPRSEERRVGKGWRAGGERVLVR